MLPALDRNVWFDQDDSDLPTIADMWSAAFAPDAKDDDRELCASPLRNAGEFRLLHNCVQYVQSVARWQSRNDAKLKEITMFNTKTATTVNIRGAHSICKVYVQGDEARFAADMTVITDPGMKAQAITAARKAEAKHSRFADAYGN